MSDEKKDEKKNTNEQQPDLGFKSFMTPYTLLLLQNSTLHGYELWGRLSMNIPGLNENDRPSLYRLLRQLEEEGKVTSNWSTEAKNGPARRVYTLTDAGRDFLNLWAEGLKQYQNTLDFFFKLYTGGMIPSPFERLRSPASENKDHSKE